MIDYPKNLHLILPVKPGHLPWVAVLLSLVSLSVLSIDTFADALLAAVPSNDSAACAFSKLVGVTRSRSNAFGNASPSRSLLEQTLSWSSHPSTEPTPNSGKVSSYKTERSGNN